MCLHSHLWGLGSLMGTKFMTSYDRSLNLSFKSCFKVRGGLQLYFFWSSLQEINVNVISPKRVETQCVCACHIGHSHSHGSGKFEWNNGKKELM